MRSRRPAPTPSCACDRRVPLDRPRPSSVRDPIRLDTTIHTIVSIVVMTTSNVPAPAVEQRGARMTTRRMELSAGPVEYVDTGGDGPSVVLLHGLLMDASLWDDVVADLSVDHRCIVPTLPLGAHLHAMHDDADLSL